MTMTATNPDPASAAPSASDGAHKARILIVDDTLTVRLYCSQLLRRGGFAVSEAINGLEGLEQALNQPFDLFVVDINMQKMDGYAFLAEVRRHEDLRSVPAVMMSTEQGREDIARAYQSGANFYLTKPIDPTRFLSTVYLMTGVPCP
mgnify:CR=1 FL=1